MSPPRPPTLTGLAEGTPVACGLHDVTASALGMGGHEEGTLSIVAGTYSINEVVSSEPRIDQRWFCRNAIDAGRWNNMAISPASTANYDWFLDTFCRSEQDEDQTPSGGSIHELLASEIDAALKRPSTILFHPYLFGSPYGECRQRQLCRPAWLAQSRRHAEGGAGRHRLQPPHPCRGAARGLCRSRGTPDRRRLPQPGLRADVCRRAQHAGAPSLRPTKPLPLAQLFAPAPRSACSRRRNRARAPLSTTVRQYQPDAARSAVFDERFSLYCRIANSLKPQWPEIERLAGQSMGGTA